MQADLAVFARDFPEARLVAEVKPRELASNENEDPTVRQMARGMWGANCHYGLIVTPAKTYVLRDDFTTRGPGAIRVTNVVPTQLLLGRVGAPKSAGRPEGPLESVAGEQLEFFTRKWLERLATDYEKALPDDAEVVSVFFPEIVGAVADGRVVTLAGV